MTTQTINIKKGITFNGGFIKEIQEWAYVYFVKFFKGSPMFVKKTDLVENKDTFDKAGKAFQEGNLEKSLSLWNQAVEDKYKNNAAAWENRGLVLIKLFEWDEAKKSYEKALELNPDSQNAKGALYFMAHSQITTPWLKIDLYDHKWLEVGTLFQLNEMMWVYKRFRRPAVFFMFFSQEKSYNEKTIYAILNSKIGQRTIKQKVGQHICRPVEKITIIHNEKDEWIDIDC